MEQGALALDLGAVVELVADDAEDVFGGAAFVGDGVGEGTLDAEEFGGDGERMGVGLEADLPLLAAVGRGACIREERPELLFRLAEKTISGAADVLCQGAKTPAGAQAFGTWLQGERARNLLQANGFEMAGGAAPLRAGQG